MKEFFFLQEEQRRLEDERRRVEREKRQEFVERTKNLLTAADVEKPHRSSGSSKKVIHSLISL